MALSSLGEFIILEPNVFDVTKHVSCSILPITVLDTNNVYHTISISYGLKLPVLMVPKYFTHVASMLLSTTCRVISLCSPQLVDKIRVPESKLLLLEFG